MRQVNFLEVKPVLIDNEYMKLNIRLLYLYLFSFVGLLILVIGTIRLVDLGMKVVVFKDADVYDYAYRQPVPIVEGEKVDSVKQEKEAREMAITETKRNRQREASGALAMIIVGLPLYLYHWKLVEKEK